MANVDATLNLQERTIVRKKLATVRDQGLVPGVIHNHGQASVHIMAPELELRKIYKEAGKHHPLNLSVGDQKFLALIRDVHFHPAKRRLDHIVFQAIRQDEKVEAEIPLHFEGDAPAEKIGLMVLHQLDHVEVEALPKDLVDEILIDASKLAELGDEITVADLQIPAGITVLTDADHPIARVVETRAQMSEESEAAEAAEGVEGEAGAEGEAGEGGEAEATSDDAPKE